MAEKKMKTLIFFGIVSHNVLTVGQAAPFQRNGTPRARCGANGGMGRQRKTRDGRAHGRGCRKTESRRSDDDHDHVKAILLQLAIPIRPRSRNRNLFCRAGCQNCLRRSTHFSLPSLQSVHQDFESINLKPRIFLIYAPTSVN